MVSCSLPVLVLDEPTIGIDVGAREEIYNLIFDFVRSGEKGLLFLSAIFQEILSGSDRIWIMSQGRLIAELDLATSPASRNYGPCFKSQLKKDWKDEPKYTG